MKKDSLLSLTRIKYIVLGIYTFVPFLLLFFDLNGIREKIPVSASYDWLVFIGTYISGFVVMIISYITLKQNDNLASINQKSLEASIISNNKFSIMLDKNQEIIENVYKLKILEITQTPLKAITVNKIIFQTHNNGQYLGDDNIVSNSKCEYQLEYTDNANKKDHDFYLANINVKFPFEKVEQNNDCKLIIDMTVKSIYGVAISYTYSIMLKAEIKENKRVVFIRTHTFQNIKDIFYVSE